MTSRALHLTPYLATAPALRSILHLRPEVVFRGVVKLEDGTPVEGTITFSRDGRVRFGRTNAQGEFTLRMRSAFDYKLFEISRIVVPAGSDHPVLERFVPLERLPLKPDGDTAIIVEPRS